MNKPDPIPARLAALKTTPTPDLKQQWRDLFASEPPPFNRRYLESRLAYRIQELAYGGLKPETIRRLERLGEELDGGDKRKRSIRADRDRPITGTRLLREWRGVEMPVPRITSPWRRQRGDVSQVECRHHRMAHIGPGVAGQARQPGFDGIQRLCHSGKAASRDDSFGVA